MRLHKYLFYRFYVITSKFENDIPHWGAATELTIVDFLATMSLFCIIAPHWTKSLYSVKANWSQGFCIMLLFFLPNYFLYIRRDRYKKIIKQFEGESRKT